jgi:rubredoxin
MKNNDQNIQVDLRNCPTYQCSNCENIFFEEVVIIKILPGLMIGTGKNEVFPVKILRCKTCGEIIEDHKPLLETPKN